MSRAWLLLLLLGVDPAYAGPAMTPARLTEGAHSIESLVRLPEGLDPGRYTIQCETLVRRDGDVDLFICYSSQEQWYPIASAVADAGWNARFIPATRDGKPVRVYMHVMVLIDVTEQGIEVLAVPNDGLMADRYGLHYIAPQRLNEFFWGGKALCMVKGRVLIWQKLDIDEQGNVSEYMITNAANAKPWMLKRLDAGVRRMQFMPGLYDGKPVQMFFFEPAFNN